MNWPHENPELLIEEPFEQDGLCYEYAQMTEEPVETTESRTVSQTVTVESQNAETEENRIAGRLHPLRGGRVCRHADAASRLRPHGSEGVRHPFLHGVDAATRIWRKTIRP